MVVTRPEVADNAAAMLRDELVAIDAACSRFRDDAELAGLQRADGGPVRVSALLFEALTVACDVACRTGGAVDPTVGAAMEALGYDRDFDEVGDGPTTPVVARPAPGWWCIELDPRRRTARVPRGVRVDLGATAKALVADRAARRIAGALATGALVSIGGDVAVDGPPPQTGWAVGIATDSSTPPERSEQVVAIDAGGVASSSTTVRTWSSGGRTVHHIVDPATGDSVPAHWALVSVAADSCVEANALSTAAVVWGAEAEPKVAATGRPARLVHHDGRVVTVNGWPAGSGAGAR